MPMGHGRNPAILPAIRAYGGHLVAPDEERGGGAQRGEGPGEEGALEGLGAGGQGSGAGGRYRR